MKMRKCINCDVYTLKVACPKCGGPTKNPNPPPFSPEDRFGKYRRIAKNENAEKLRNINC